MSFLRDIVSHPLVVHGGWVMVAIFGLSVLGWAVSTWKWLALRHERRGGRLWPRQVISMVTAGRLEDAVSACRQHATMIGRLMLEGLTCREPERAWFENRLAPVLDAETERLHRGINIVGLCAVVAPLLGLLGTVIGMMRSFDVITTQGTKDPALLADGIGQALLTTQAGLLVALPLLLLHRYLLSSARRIENRASLYVKKIETILCDDGDESSTD